MKLIDELILFKARVSLNFAKILYPKADFSTIPIVYIHDSPSKYTKLIINLLNSLSINAVFFIIGKNIDKNLELVKNLQWFVVGNHSFAHRRLNYFFNFKAFRNDLEKCEALLVELGIPNTKKLYSPPFGILSRKAYRYLIDEGYTIVFGNNYFDDRKIRNTKILTSMFSGALNKRESIIIHDSEVLYNLLKNIYINNNPEPIK